MKKNSIVKIKPVLFGLTLCLSLLPGCSGENTFDYEIKGPQVIVNPGAVRLSIASLAKTAYVFSGRGFTPGESILVEMLNVPGDDGPGDIAVANAQVNERGTFEAEIGLVTKISEFMRAKIDAIKGIIIISRDPIPEGEYDIRVSSLMSDTIVNRKITVEGPSIIDSIKDMLGVMLGKIVEEPGDKK